MKGIGKKRGTILENRITDQNINELKNISDSLKKQNLKVGDISKELYENNMLTQLLRKEISGIKDAIKKNNGNPNEQVEFKNKLALYKSEINNLKKQLINEKEEKIKVQEELFNMYEKEERLLKSHRKLILKYQALSNSNLGKLTFAYWEFLKRFKRGKRNGNN